MIQMPYELNLRHLRALLDAQDGGSISAGARAACLSQSALTQAVAKVEKQLACVLFDRHVEGVSATATGAQALERVRAALTSPAVERPRRVADSTGHRFRCRAGQS